MSDSKKTSDAVEVYLRFNRQERKRILAVQKYWLGVMEREYRRAKSISEHRLAKRAKEREERQRYKTDRDLFDAYMVCEVSDEEYKVLLNKRHRQNRFKEWKYTDRMNWLDAQILERKALIADLEEHMDDPVYKYTPNAYDPTRNASKYNFPRENWITNREIVKMNKRERTKGRDDERQNCRLDDCCSTNITDNDMVGNGKDKV